MLLQAAQVVFKRQLISAITLPIVLLLLLSGVSMWQITRLLSAMQWVDHTNRVIAQANQVQKLLLDMETGLRGYLLAGEQEFLEPYQQSSSQINTALDELGRLVSDNPGQVQRVAELRTQQVEWNRSVPQLLARQPIEEAVQISFLRTRKQLMDKMRSQIAAFITIEEQLRDKRTHTARQTTHSIIVTSIGLAAAIGGFLAYLIRRQLLSVSQTYEHALQTAQEQTEKAQRSAQRLSTLHEIDRAILAAQSIESLAAEALSRLKPILPSDQAAVLTFNWDTNQARILAGEIAGDVAQRVVSISERVSLEWLRNREPTFYVEDIATLNPRPPALERQLADGYHSFLAVALLVEDNLIGDLTLFARQTAAFSSQDQEIAREIAAQLAIAIQQEKLRSQLQGYASELEQRVAERTVKLEEINHELESFTYSVSHDLRAPLRTIQGFAQALLEDYGDSLDELGQEYARYLVEGAMQMDTLITDLLAYSRLSRTEIQLQPIALDAVVQEALHQLSTQLQERQAMVSIESPLPEVMGHRSILVQVITNLLSNALKFVEPDIQPQVRVWAQKEQDWIRLWVMDNGIGIAPEHQERIFRIFERLHGVESYPGTGIGLAIVRKGVERMGGRMGVESQPGTGSRFWLALPPVASQSTTS